MKMYTTAGDDGSTGLLGGERVAKYDPRIEAIGTLDEANAAIGLARAYEQHAEFSAWLRTIQQAFYRILAEVAATAENSARFRSLVEADVTVLESWIDQLGQQVQMPSEFIMPGDSVLSASYDLARTAVRRAERRVAELLHGGMFENPQALRYLNRLSSLCFMLELSAIQRSGADSPSLAKNP